MAKSWGRQWRIVTLALVVGAGAALVPSGALATAPGDLSVIVRSSNGEAAAAQAVRSVGGTVTRSLSIVDGVSADVSPSQASALSTTSGITVSPDSTMTVSQPAAAKPGGGHGGGGGGGGGGGSSSGSLFDQVVNANKVWAAGNKGSGQTVALIDTGIADVPDLASRVVSVQADPLGTTTARCENLSGEKTKSGASDCNDNFGHGTFIAGLIAGTGAASNGARLGVAPQANLVSVKVAGRSGSSDVSTVLAAIQWVVSFKDTYHITVLNLSLGTDSTQSWQHDPLNYAVEKAWNSGIVVVVAAGNHGPNAGTISKPADDPWVVTVGAIDDAGTVPLTDDALPNFSSRGPAPQGVAKPDLAAPGAHVVSVTSPGSAIDQQFPSTVDANYRKGSGTSMSTGIVSGVVALMRAGNASWDPNQVKYALTTTARADRASGDPSAIGHGVVDAFNATYHAGTGNPNAGLNSSDGLGSIGASRGSVAVKLIGGIPRNTILDSSTSLTAQLLTFDDVVYTSGVWSTTTWYGSSFAGNNWYGNNWYGNNWYGNNWYGNNFDSSTPYGNNWYGSNWYGAWDAA